jgi:hypothetical protein
MAQSTQTPCSKNASFAPVQPHIWQKHGRQYFALLKLALALASAKS